MFTSYTSRLAILTCLALFMHLPVISQGLIINEIYADPYPKGSVKPLPDGLPSTSGAEYVEIYNRGSASVTCSGYSLSGKSLPDFTIGPGQYVIFCPGAYTGQYLTMGEVIPLTSWNTLSNGGERIYLSDSQGAVVDEITYSSGWHAGGKDRGGWSLERINPVLNCSNDNNWTSSGAAIGGTPGMANSVMNAVPDTTAPELVYADWLTTDRVQILFSENIYAEQVSLSSDPVLELASATNGKELSVNILSQIVAGQSYTFHIAGVYDCEGNRTEPVSIRLSLDMSPPVLQSSEIISSSAVRLTFDEALDDASVYTGTYDYTCGLEVANITWKADLPDEVVLQSTEPFAEGDSCTLSFSGITDKSGNGVSGHVPFIYLPVLDTAYTEDPGIVKVRYREMPDNALHAENYYLHTFEGHPFIVLANSEDSTEVKLVFSPAPMADQALTLSVSNMVSGGRRLITPACEISWDTKPPSLKSYVLSSPDSLRLTFSEPLDEEMATISSHYELSSGPAICRITTSGPEVLIVFCEPLQQESEYRMRIHNLTDRFGNRMRRSKYIDLYLDHTPPTVTYARVISPSSVSFVLSEKASGLILMDENIWLPPGFTQPDSLLQFTTPQGDSIVLQFPYELPKEPFELGLTGISDLQGNAIRDTVYTEIENSVPQIGYLRLTADTALIATFSHGINPASRADVVTTVNGQPARLDSVDGDIMLIAWEDRLPEGPVSVRFNNVLFNDRSVDLVGTTSYRKPLAGFSISGPNLLRIYWKGDVPAKNTVDLFHVQGIEPLLVWNDTEVGVSNVLLQDNLAENSIVNLDIAAFSAEDDRYWPASHYQAVYDRRRPRVTELAARSNRDIGITFSEKPDYAAALSPYHYRINGEWPQSCTFEGETSVIIRAAETLSDQQDYEVYISGIRDTAGNTLSDTTIQFMYRTPSRLTHRDLVISELLPVPSPDSPAAPEFVELKNTTADTLIINGSMLSDRSTAGSIEQVTVLPGQYLILTSESDKDYYAGFGKTAAVKPWPSLNNTDDDLYLISEAGDTVLSQNYQTTGLLPGQSLERVDLYADCPGETNWLPSLSAGMHTAGFDNSVRGQVDDAEVPRLLASCLTKVGTCMVWLSESPAGTLTKDQVRLTTVDDIEQSLSGIREVSSGVYEIICLVPLDLTQSYQLTLSDITDCAGNAAKEMKAAPVIYPQKPSIGDIILTEILFDPPPGGVDFIECYNSTEKYINMADLYFYSIDRQEEIQSGPPVIIAPSQYLAFTPDPVKLSEQYPAAPYMNMIKQALPAMPDGEGTVGLKDASDSVYQLFAYQDDYHNRLIRDPEGVSLERVSLSGEVNTPSEWASAAADKGYGTPGAVNSQYINSYLPGENAIHLSTRIITPDFDGVDDFVQIHYSFENGENIANAWVYDVHGNRIITLTEGAVTGSSGSLRWEGISDSGKVVESGYYLAVLEYFSTKTGRGIIRRKIAVSNF
ncbi:MAG: lamin tail domain-containing protein [Cyclobacteriaceae bacterium]